MIWSQLEDSAENRFLKILIFISVSLCKEICREPDGQSRHYFRRKHIFVPKETVCALNQILDSEIRLQSSDLHSFLWFIYFLWGSTWWDSGMITNWINSAQETVKSIKNSAGTDLMYLGQNVQVVGIVPPKRLLHTKIACYIRFCTSLRSISVNGASQSNLGGAIYSWFSGCTDVFVYSTCRIVHPGRRHFWGQSELWLCWEYFCPRGLLCRRA